MLLEHFLKEANTVCDRVSKYGSIKNESGDISAQSIFKLFVTEEILLALTEKAKTNELEKAKLHCHIKI